jgi:hypothetical protein
MMKQLALAAIFSMMCRTSPVAAQQAKDDASIQPVPLCAVIADASKYDGKEIVVRGLYRSVIHGTILMDHACPKADVGLREAPGYKADKHASALLRSLLKKNQFQPVDVVFRGTFRVAREGQCFGQICSLYELETTELVSARPVPPEAGSDGRVAHP